MNKRSLIFIICISLSLFLLHFIFSGDDKKQNPSTPTAQTEATPLIPTMTPPSKDEQFYVIENEYQQLVFSNIGGALSEINLHLYDKEHPESPIRPIRFDKIMAKEFPGNDKFPSFPYQINQGSGVETKEGCVGGYYPLLRRSLFSAKGDLLKPSAPRLYALNVIEETPNTQEQVYRLKRLEKNLIEFESEQSQRKITKTFSFAKNPKEAPYCIELMIKIEGDARNLFLTSGVPEVELISGDPAPSLKYLVVKSNQKKQVEQLSLKPTTMTSVYPDWICNSNGFLGLIIDPVTEIGAGFKSQPILGTLDPSRITLVDAEYQRYPAEKYPGYEMLLPLKAQTMQFRVYAGPFEDDILKQVDKVYADPVTGSSPTLSKRLASTAGFPLFRNLLQSFYSSSCSFFTKSPPHGAFRSFFSPSLYASCFIH